MLNLSTSYLLMTKGKTATLHRRNLEGTAPYPVIKANVTNAGINKQHMPLGFCGIPPKTHNLNSIKRKYQTNPK